MGYRPTFKLAVITPEALLYQNQVESVFITGDTGEYELLPYHFPLVGILAEGNIIINWKEAIPIRFGIVKFFANDCIILVEEPERLKKTKKKEEDIVVDADE
jgi:F0F1-type ATP synthase epsilon subunit